jgi:hypothetical protein
VEKILKKRKRTLRVSKKEEKGKVRKKRRECEKKRIKSEKRMNFLEGKEERIFEKSNKINDYRGMKKKVSKK